jgi:nucleotide-binding universal stress UspA family protein
MLDAGPILVPLDGSELAEGVLPYAQRLASALRTHLALVSVWEGADATLGPAFMAAAPEIERAARERWQAYLEDVRRRAGASNAKLIVREGDPAHEIAAVAEEEGARLPVLAAGPDALKPTGDTPMRHIMAPLDGSRLAEQALPAAALLAAALEARVSIVRAVPWAIESYPYTTPQSYVPQLDEELEKGATTYVTRMAGGLQAPGGVEAHVVRGHAAQALLDFATGHGVDLVVMTTHARAGLARAALGSTADRMLQGAAPVLLIPPDAAQGA